MTIEQKKDEIARSMIGAGIGSYYHGITLASFGKAGEQVKQRINEPGFKSAVLSGSGFSIISTDLKECAFPFVVARALRLARIDVRVARLTPLVRYIETGHTEDFEDTRFSEFDRAQALVIPGFFEHLDEKPFTRRELYRVENFLTELMDSGFSVSVQHYGGNLERQDWFSPRLIARLQERNMEVTV